MRECATTIAQDRASSVIHGMPATPSLLTPPLAAFYLPGDRTWALIALADRQNHPHEVYHDCIAEERPQQYVV